jgi:hypothetical protein
MKSCPIFFWFRGVFGNGKFNADKAGRIKEGQIVSMEADLDKGTLRLWVDGKQHGPSLSSGVSDWSFALGCEFELQKGDPLFQIWYLFWKHTTEPKKNRAGFH